ncbi:MAG: hypothetical protein Q3M24_11775 [Candidatus Electrothrix aestuarii]|uniref:Uncharacterized protein n=1 Tax=Candidatus Electrothrix aestuarii TaxID=3062594 RepID=A0AAU8M1J9_9BACT
MNKLFLITAGCLVVLLTASYSYANAGIPIVAVQLPFMLSLLVPVILIEAILLRESLSLHWFTATLISFKANLISTVLGCPIAWFLQFFASIPISASLTAFYKNEILDRLSDLVILASVILPFPAYEGKIFWLIPFGGIVGLLPAYFVTVWFEYPFIRKQAHERKVNPKRLMYRVNLFSYALLVGVWGLQLCFNLLQGDEVSLFSADLF